LEEEIVALYEDGAKYDYALLKLEKNVERSQYFALFQDLNTLPKLTVCGYNDSDTLMSHSNKPAARKDGILFYDIDTASGQSGSPLFEEEEDSIKIVGVHKGYSPRAKLNLATLITVEMVSDLYKLMLEMGVSFQVINPIAKPSTTEI